MPKFSLCAAVIILVGMGPTTWGQTAPTREGRKGAVGVGTEYVYKKVEGRSLRLWVVEPAGVKEGDTKPGIVFFHGGGWVGGGPNQFDRHAQYFASRGMVAVQVEYRLLGKGANEPPAVCIQDAKSAMRWVRGHAKELKVDPQRIASAGGSAGGHLAAAVAMLPGIDEPGEDVSVSPKSQAMILFNAVIDNGPGEYGYGRVGERYKEFSPAYHVSAETPPALVFAGEKDHLIPVASVQRFKGAMEKAGARCEVHVYAGQGHGFFNDGRGKGDGYYYRETARVADEFLASLGWIQGAPTISATTQPSTRAVGGKGQ